MSYAIISYISFAVGGILTILSIFLFFFYKIPKVVGDLTGLNARKAITAISNSNNTTNLSKRKDKVHTKNLENKSAKGYITANLNNGTADETTILRNETTILNPSETVVLSGVNTQNYRPETMVLKQGMAQTNKLCRGILGVYEEIPLIGKIQLQNDITFVHSDEIII